MILMAGLARLPVTVVGVLGVALIVGPQRPGRPLLADRVDAQRARVGGIVEDPVFQLLCRADHGRRRWPAPDGALLDRAVDRRDGRGLRLRRRRRHGPGSTTERVPRHRASAHRALRRPARLESLRRPAALGHAGRRRTADAGAVRFPQHDQVPGVAAVSADDARPDNRAGAAARATRGRRSPDG